MQPIQQLQPTYEQPKYQEPMHSQQVAATICISNEPPMLSATVVRCNTQQPVNVQQAQFASFEEPSITQAEARNLNMLLRYSITSNSRTWSYKAFC